MVVLKILNSIAGRRVIKLIKKINVTRCHVAQYDYFSDINGNISKKKYYT
jgi:hypothetical protein